MKAGPRTSARLLTVAPVAAAVICGFRRPKPFVAVAVSTVLLTVACVMLFGRLTGISTGVGPPIVMRTVAGVLAVALTIKVAGPVR